MMEQSRARAAGDQRVATALRSVLFSEVIVGAASVRPKGFTTRTIVLSLGWFAQYFTRKATDPLPPTILYLAVTPVDIRLFSKPGLAAPFEIGRWKNGSYRASIGDSFLSLRLDLDLERLGRARVYANRSMRPVFELVVRGAAGPVI